MQIRRLKQEDREQFKKLLYDFYISHNRGKLLKDSPLMRFAEYKNDEDTIEMGKEL